MVSLPLPVPEIPDKEKLVKKKVRHAHVSYLCLLLISDIEMGIGRG